MIRSLWHLARPTEPVTRAQNKFGSKRNAKDREVLEREECYRERHPDERRSPFLEAETKTASVKRRSTLLPGSFSAANARNLRFEDGRRARLCCRVGRTAQSSTSTVRTTRLARK